MELPDARREQQTAHTLSRVPFKYDVSDLVLQETRHALRRLAAVPVDREFAERLTALLAAHGATVSRQYTRRYERRDQEATEIQTEYAEYFINFPDGTERAYKLRMRTTAPFVIYFPDGFELHGAEVSRSSIRDKPTIILYLPRE